MTHIVTENCINCKYTDCAAVCPVDCFYEGENMVAINPTECIDCGVCVGACPANAIVPDNIETWSKEELQRWEAINAKYAQTWPNIKVKKAQLPKADLFNNELNGNSEPNKYERYFDERAAT